MQQKTHKKIFSIPNGMRISHLSFRDPLNIKSCTLIGAKGAVLGELDICRPAIDPTAKLDSVNKGFCYPGTGLGIEYFHEPHGLEYTLTYADNTQHIDFLQTIFSCVTVNANGNAEAYARWNVVQFYCHLDQQKPPLLTSSIGNWIRMSPHKSGEGWFSACFDEPVNCEQVHWKIEDCQPGVEAHIFAVANNSIINGELKYCCCGVNLKDFW